jgi:hypothetical protein
MTGCAEWRSGSGDETLRTAKKSRFGRKKAVLGEKEVESVFGAENFSVSLQREPEQSFLP